MIVLLLHGIRTDAFWHTKFDEVVTRLASQDRRITGITVESRKYGNFPVIQYAIPQLRNRKIKWLRQKLVELRTAHPNENICIVSHSFGTYLVAETLLRNPGLQIDIAILCGSVVKRDFDWNSLFENQQVTTIINDCGRRDVWPIFSRIYIPGTGDSGVFGFDFGGKNLRNRFFPYYAHSDFFEEPHITRYWWPFIADRSVVPGPPAKPAKVPTLLIRLRWVLRLITFTIVVLVPLAFSSNLAHEEFKKYQQFKAYTTTLQSSRNLASLFQSALQELNKITSTDYNQILLFHRKDDYSHELVVVADSISGSKQRYRTALLVGLIGEAFETGSTLNVPLVRQNPKHIAAVPETQSELVIPIKHGNAVLGVFNTESDQAEYFEVEMVTKLELLSTAFAEQLFRLNWNPDTPLNDIPWIRSPTS